MTARNLVRELARSARRTPVRASLAALLSIGNVLAVWAVAQRGGRFVPRLLSPITPFRDLASEAGIIILLIAIVTLTTALRDLLLSAHAAAFTDALRTRMFRALVRRPMDAGEDRHAGQVVARIASDTSLLHHSLTRVLAIWLPAVLTSAILLLSAVVTSPLLALATLALLVPPIFVTVRVGDRMRESTRQAQQAAEEMGHLLGECLAGVREAKIYRREVTLERQLMSLSARATQQLVREERIALTNPAVMTFIASLVLAVVVLVAAWGVRSGRASPEDVSRFLILVAIMVAPLQESLRSVGALTRASALLGRCEAIVRQPAEDPTSTEEDVQESTIPVRRPAATLQLRDLTLERDSSRFTLGPVSASLGEGDVLVITGASGAGKSTLLEAIPRLIEPTSGEIRVDGRDVRALGRRAGRRGCAYVPQEPFFFAGRVAENLEFARPGATREEMQRALVAANADEFVRALPGGLDATLGSGGRNLSVGQRRRLALARALLSGPRLLLLDEPTAGLDADSEAEVIASLRALAGRVTMVIATHSAAVQSLAHSTVRLRRGEQVPSHAPSCASTRN